MPLVVEILSGSRRGHRVVFDKPVVTLGRHPDNDVVFDAVAEPLVSAFHAEIREVGAGRHVILDRGSSNGTWAGGDRFTQLAFEGRLEVRLAQSGPVVALMPMLAVPAQAGDAVTVPDGAVRAAKGPAIDPMVVAPTVDGPVQAWSAAADAEAPELAPPGGYRGPARIGGPMPGDFSPPGGAPSPLAAPSTGRGAAEPARGQAPMPTVPSWQRASVSLPTERMGVPSPARLGMTAQIRAVAGDMVRRTSRRFWVAVVVLALLLAGTAVFLALVLTGTVTLGGAPEGSTTPRTAGPGSGAEAGTTAAAAVPAVPQHPSAKEIVAGNQDAIFLLGAEILGRSEGFCTGFALTPRILATNAHCVIEMQKIWEALGPGQGVFAYQNGHPGVKHRVQFAIMHPEYKEDETDAIYPDIGLAVIEGRTDRQVKLASKQRAAQLRVGDRVYLLGFPGALNSAESPVATLTEGILGRLTDLGQRKAEPEDSVLLQHSAFTTKGTSGSPLFDENGEVIGINTGYYRGESEQQRLDPVTGRVRDEMVTQDLQNYAIGMRVDLVHDLLQLLYERIPGTQEPGADGGP